TVATRLQADGYMDAESARRIRWLDAFGQLIANTDRHLGNLSVFRTGAGRFELAPAYDMLPMLFAPSGTVVVDRPFQPAPPSSQNLDVWNNAAEHAHQYWSRVIDCAELTPEFRARSRDCRDALDDLRERVPRSATA
ncbi:MAG: HipA domain-containing protein, partial [Myxococcaceae bacterium]